MSSGGEQAAFVHRAIDGGLGGGGRPRLGQRPAAGLAAGRQGVGAHQELEGKTRALRAWGGETFQAVTKFGVVSAFFFSIRSQLWGVAPLPPLLYLLQLLCRNAGVQVFYQSSKNLLQQQTPRDRGRLILCNTLLQPFALKNPNFPGVFSQDWVYTGFLLWRHNASHLRF